MIPDFEEPDVSENGQAEPLLVAERVRKVYRTGGVEVEALAGLDLSLRRGELVAVMGPSGSGKTTLLRCLNLLEVPSGGRIRVGEIEIDASKPLKQQQGLIHPSDVEFDQTVGLMIAKMGELAPDRMAIDALTELRLLAQDSLAFRRQILTLKRFFARSAATVSAALQSGNSMLAISGSPSASSSTLRNARRLSLSRTCAARK